MRHRRLPGQWKSGGHSCEDVRPAHGTRLYKVSQWYVSNSATTHEADMKTALWNQILAHCLPIYNPKNTTTLLVFKNRFMYLKNKGFISEFTSLLQSTLSAADCATKCYLKGLQSHEAHTKGALFFLQSRLCSWTARQIQLALRTFVWLFQKNNKKKCKNRLFQNFRSIRWWPPDGA